MGFVYLRHGWESAYEVDNILAQITKNYGVEMFHEEVFLYFRQCESVVFLFLQPFEVYKEGIIDIEFHGVEDMMRDICILHLH